jgi:hypothetical protein
VWEWPQPVPLVPFVPETPSQWALCLSPLLLLPLLLLLRRRRFVVTEDFLVEMADRGLLKEISERHRWVWVVPSEHVERYEGRTLGGVDLRFMLRTADTSESDVNDLMRRIGVQRPEAVLLAVARRTKNSALRMSHLRWRPVRSELTHTTASSSSRSSSTPHEKSE